MKLIKILLLGIYAMAWVFVIHSMHETKALHEYECEPTLHSERKLVK